MLEELHIAGLGVIEDAWLSLHPGLNVLTGETGAGKTMIAVGLGLTLGGRGSAAMLRPGVSRLAVDARFARLAPQGELAEWLDAPPDEDGGDPSVQARDAELILSRTIGPDGRSACRINGRMAPAASLESVGSRLVEIHGQNQAERLAAAAAQTDFLDRFAGAHHRAEVAAHRMVHSALARLRANLHALERGAMEREREKDLLAYQIREIEAASVVSGEMAALGGVEARLAHAERILELASGIEAMLGEDDGAVDALRAAAESARAIASLDPGGRSLAERLANVSADATDVAEEVRVYRDTLELDPFRLEQVRERIQALRSLERRYGQGEEAILAFLAQARERLGSLEDDEASREPLVEEMRELESRRSSIAAGVSSRRREAASRLADLLTGEVRALGMPGASVQVGLRPLAEPGPDGEERVEVFFSGGPNQATRPLAKVASGGELARTMLACRAVLADLDDVPTLVFDEVDAGIGGRAAGAVAARLSELARHRQVLVVTHLAQIAARADRHLLVSKDEGTATVRPVEEEERVAELARMLAGSTADVSMAHARALLAEAAAARREGSSRVNDAASQRDDPRPAVGAAQGRSD